MAAGRKITQRRRPSRERNQGQELRLWTLRNKKELWFFFKDLGANFAKMLERPSFSTWQILQQLGKS
jgi:hypothetical protein